MFAKINPTGCEERKGLVKVRIDFYLDPADARYSERHIQVVDISSNKYLKGYTGKVNDAVAYQKWLDTLPKVWQDNPFHCHFIQVAPDATDASILSLAKEHLVNFYEAWSGGQAIQTGWKNKVQPVENISLSTASKVKVEDIKARLCDTKIEVKV